jgi:hypothetical protein
MKSYLVEISMYKTILMLKVLRLRKQLPIYSTIMPPQLFKYEELANVLPIHGFSKDGQYQPINYCLARPD